ncbi:permease [Galactobacter caseinivorans]|uniref:Permease n=1 Tax=Galactobacter caseinivorans TaxID=2676123 RepID=A0A496PI90_9MICC|nr:permease [Galactobacter caseinivorans]RKW70188.1 permease [Galactobacter caseinivorans]
MTVIRLTWLLRRATDKRAALIGAGAYALVTALLLITLGGGWAFMQWQGEEAPMYQMLATLALILLVVPLAYLGAAAARLSARAQDRRLSTLRLVGATGPQVGGVTVLGAASEALVGVLGGAVLAAAATPLVGLIHFRGEALGAQLWLPWWLQALVMLAVVVLAGVSAMGGLRRVLVTPLGVRTRQVAKVPSWLRVVVALGLVVGGSSAMTMNGAVGEAFGTAGMVVMVLGVLLGGLVALNAIGPWVLRVWGNGRVRRASTPQALLAARTVLDDPAATWRQVSGAAMAGFVAVVGGVGAAMMSQVSPEATPAEALMAADVLTGVVVTLVIAFVGVVCTTLVAQAATVLDREELTGALETMGVPAAFSTQARVGALMRPLIIVLLLAIVSSAALLFPLVGMAMIMQPLTVAIVAGVCAGGVLAVRGATSLAGRVSQGGARIPAGV